MDFGRIYFWPKSSVYPLLEGPQGRTVDLTPLRAVRFIMAEKVDELVLRDLAP